jgi:hypothetical protein
MTQKVLNQHPYLTTTGSAKPSIEIGVGQQFVGRG